MAAEFRRLAPLLARHPDHVLAAHAGMGPARAEHAAHALVEAGARTLVSFGFAGGLDPDLKAGALVVPTLVIEPTGSRIVTSAPALPGLPTAASALATTLISAPTEVESVADKAALREATQAAAVDLETFVIASVAARHGVACTAIRAVLDTANQALPAGLSGCVDEFGRLAVPAFATWLIGSPRGALALPALALAERRAGRALEAAAHALADALDESTGPD